MQRLRAARAPPPIRLSFRYPLGLDVERYASARPYRYHQVASPAGFEVEV